MTDPGDKVSSNEPGWRFCRWQDCQGCTSRFADHSAPEIAVWLSDLVRDPAALANLRWLMDKVLGEHLVHRLDDPSLIAEAAQLIASGSLRVCGAGRVVPTPPPPPPGPPPPPTPPQPGPRPPPAPNPLKGSLFVEVYDEHGKLVTERLDIQASGPQSLSAATRDGTHTFSDIEPGVYSVTVRAPAERFETDAETTQSTPVPAGGTGRARLKFKWRYNEVTPKLELEYKVVLLDRKLSAHQDKGEVKILTDNVTAVEASITQTTGLPKYIGAATFEAVPAKVEIFTDPECKTPLAGKIPADKLLAGPVRLYLRSVSAGKFVARLTLDPSTDPRVTVKGPANEDMGVVELKMTVHQHDVPAIAKLQVDPDTEPVTGYHTALKNKALPDQVALSDAHKVSPGRLLHEQRAGHHGRAKVVVEKLDASQWPAGTDDYRIELSVLASGGALALHGQETGAHPLALPLAAKVSALKAKAQTHWVEGAGVGKAVHDTVLSLGLDRDEAGLAKTPKGKGDWARFTVVKVEEVKLEYKAQADEFPAWDEAAKRYYINVNGLGDLPGRKIKLSARITPALAGVPLRFMLAPDKDNLKTANWNIDFPADGKSGAKAVKWKDVPAAIKHLDKTDRKDLLHLGKDTDAKGLAEVEVTLSRCGGDRFHPAAYLDQDPHLAKFVHGHAVLGLREPVFAAVSPIQVWRKIFYQVTRQTATAFTGSDLFDASQRKVLMEPGFVSEKLMTDADFTESPFRPDWQFNPGGTLTPRLCIGTHNVDKAVALFEPEIKKTTPKFHVILCDEQYDAKDVVTDARTVTFTATSPGARDVAMKAADVDDDKLSLFSPPLQGGDLVVNANWRQLTKNGATWSAGPSQPMPAANIRLREARAARNIVEVTPPAGGVIDANHQVRVVLRLQAADGGYMGWAPENTVANVVKGGGHAFDIPDTMAHELGHLFGKVRTSSLAGIPDHPLFYDQRGGSGTHCAFGAQFKADPNAPPLDPKKVNERDAQGHGAGEYLKGKCMMFASGVGKKVEWCKHCALDFILFDLSKFK